MFRMDDFLPIIIFLLVIGIPVVLVLMKREKPTPVNHRQSTLQSTRSTEKPSIAINDTVKLPEPENASSDEPEPAIITILRKQQEEKERRRIEAEEKACFEAERRRILFENERSNIERTRFASLVTKVLDDLRIINDSLQKLVRLVEDTFAQADECFNQIKEFRNEIVVIVELSKVRAGDYLVSLAKKKLELLDADRHFANRYRSSLNQIEEHVRILQGELDSISANWSYFGDDARHKAINLLTEVERAKNLNAVIIERYSESSDLVLEAKRHLEPLKTKMAEIERDRKAQELEVARGKHEQEEALKRKQREREESIACFPKRFRSS